MICPRCTVSSVMGAGQSCSLCGLRLGANVWNGDLNQKLLIVAPTSFGDIFERSRHLNILTQKGVKWDLLVDAGVIPLLKEIFPRGSFIPFGHDVPKFDAWTGMMDGLKQVSPGRPEPGLLAVPEKWKKFSVAPPSVGFCYKAAEKERNDGPRLRIVEPKGVEQIPRLVHFVNWVNLQYGETLPAPFANPRLETWMDTAGLIAQLDVVVSVETAIVHLCALMRKPCVVLHGTGQGSVINYTDFKAMYPSCPIKTFLPRYGGFEGGRHAWQHFTDWATTQNEWWNSVD